MVKAEVNAEVPDDYVSLLPKKRGRKPKVKVEGEEILCMPAPNKQRCRSVEDANKPKYEFGKILASGMIGMVYLARSTYDWSFVCIKAMYGKKIAEKNIFDSIRREVKILQKVQKIPGCVRIVDVVWD